jgi:hypothetical protein
MQFTRGTWSLALLWQPTVPEDSDTWPSGRRGTRCNMGPAMEMNQIRYFLALCKEKNFTRAAARCSVSQPSLTTAIKKLEREFGGPLFDRGRRNELTDLGILVRPFLERIAWNAATAKWCADSAGSGAASAHARANGAPNAVELECGQDQGQDDEPGRLLRQEPIELMLLAQDPPKSLAAE